MSALLALMLSAAPAPVCPDLALNGEALCADPDVAAEWAKVEAAYESWRADDPRHGLIVEDRDLLIESYRRGFGYWGDGEPVDVSASEVIVALAETANDIARRGAIARSIGMPQGRDAPAGRCLVGAAMQCRVVGGGALTSSDEIAERRVVWQQIEALDETEIVPLRMTIAWDVTDAPRLIGFTETDGIVMPPRLVDNGEDLILHLPGYSSGTASANADTLYVWRAPGWANIGMESWKNDLTGRVPAGMGLWKGVEYDYYGLSSRFSLWRETDANCCPTGGDAYVDLAIGEDRLTIDNLFYQAGPALQVEAPSCPVERVAYRTAWPTQFALRFVKPRFSPGAASDLLLAIEALDEDMTVRSTDYFAFAQAQGFGSISLIPVDGPGNANGPPEPEEGYEADEPLYFNAFNAEPSRMTFIESPPQSGDPAPFALYLPDVARRYWYSNPSVTFPRDIIFGECEDEPVPE